MCRRQITFLWYVCVYVYNYVCTSTILFWNWVPIFTIYPFLSAISSLNVWQGDFVDRGYNSLEVFTILLLLKARYVVSMYACICLNLFTTHGFRLYYLYD